MIQEGLTGSFIQNLPLGSERAYDSFRISLGDWPILCVRQRFSYLRPSTHLLFALNRVDYHLTYSYSSQYNES